MKHILELISSAIALLFLVWALSMALAKDKCTVVHRSGLPILYTFQIAENLLSNWMSQDSMLGLLKLELNCVLGFEHFVETTFYGTSRINADGTKSTVYSCSTAN